MIDFIATKKTFVVIPGLPAFFEVFPGQQFTANHEAKKFSDESKARAAATAAGWVEEVYDFPS